MDLPLSWARADVTRPRLRAMPLPFSRRIWVPCADIPSAWSFPHIFQDYLRPLPKGFVLQGCQEGLARYITEQGGVATLTGIEGVLPLDAADRPSLRELARRGRRWGEIVALEPTPEHQKAMRALWQATVHGGKPQLQCAFRTDFDASVRGFALIAPSGLWLGAMTLSLMKPGYWHTELLLRRQDAPVGVMEALILKVKAHLRSEGHAWLSLGTVPFTPIPDPLHPRACWPPWRATCQGRVIMRLGRWLRFSYDYQGLYRFKQKFHPIWKPLYLCGWPDLPWRILPDLSWASRHAHLVGYAMLFRK